ncbi:MAG TPA: protein kinase [Candidatus Binatia bacterium]|nr:protein kinase [Candidatus Binatia bacterium]
MKQCPVCSTDFPDEHKTCPTDGAVLLSMEGAEWEPGVLIRGKYRILARLGKGGMGIVYKAQHIFLEEFRALKVMFPHLAQDPKFRHRFLREGKEGRKLRNNPHIVAIEDQEQAEDGSLYLAMEYIDGVTLRELLRSARGPLPIARALNIAKGMAEGLQAAHVLGIVHRDIKPDNVLMARDAAGNDIAKVADFGIMSLCEGSTVMGTRPLLTAPYAAPEQWQAQPGQRPDPRTDLYALGMTLYEMLTGRLPFRGENPVQWMHAHLTLSPPAPSELNAQLKEYPAIDALVLKLLAKDVNDRPADAQAFLRELSLAQSGIQWTSVPSAALETSTPTTVLGRTPPSGVPVSATPAVPTPAVRTPPALTPASGIPQSGEQRASDSGTGPDAARPKYVDEVLRWAERNIAQKSGEHKVGTGEAVKTPAPPSPSAPPPSPARPMPVPRVEPPPAPRGISPSPVETTRPLAAAPSAQPPAQMPAAAPAGPSSSPPPAAPPVRPPPAPAAPEPKSPAAGVSAPSAPAPSVPRYTVAESVRQSSRGPWMWISICALAISAALAVYVFVVRPQQVDRPVVQAPVAPQEDKQAQVDALLLKAEHAFSAGNYDLAIEDYEAAQRLNPSSVRAREGIERAKKAKAAENLILPGAKQ